MRAVATSRIVNLGAESVDIARCTRIAQLVLARVERLAWREGGFGSSGVSVEALARDAS